MTPRFHRCLDLVLEFEGGKYTNDPVDPGGPTKWGITLGRLRLHKTNARAADVRALTRERAAEIYYSDYWIASECDALPPPMDLLVFNRAVNSGPVRGQKLMQQILRSYGADIVIDGDIGPASVAALDGVDQRKMITEYCDRYAAYYRSLHHFWKYGRGWLRRNEAIRKRALSEITGERFETVTTASKDISKIDWLLRFIPPGYKTIVGIGAYMALTLIDRHDIAPTIFTDGTIKSGLDLAAGLAGVGLIAKLERGLYWLGVLGVLKQTETEKKETDEAWRKWQAQ